MPQARGIDPVKQWCTTDLASEILSHVMKSPQQKHVKHHWAHLPQFWSFHLAAGFGCDRDGSIFSILGLLGSVGRRHCGTHGAFSAITTTVKIWSFAHKAFLTGEDPSDGL